MIHVTCQRMELSEQVTTPTMLTCNINNKTIKFCSSCKQYSTVQCIQIREHSYIYDEQAQLSFLRSHAHCTYKIKNLKEIHTVL